jgi:hypothetical protein
VIEKTLWSLALVVIIARLTRLAVVDEFPPAAAVRHWFVRTFATVDRVGRIERDRERWGRLAGVAYSVAYIWTCPWCMSIWVGGLVWGVSVWWPVVIWPAAVIAAGSMLAGWDANAQGEHDKRYEIMERKLLGHDDKS